MPRLIAATSTAQRSSRATRLAYPRDAAQAANVECKSDGRFGKQDFAYLLDEDAY
jgi:hypothetical protein